MWLEGRRKKKKVSVSEMILDGKRNVGKGKNVKSRGK